MNLDYAPTVRAPSRPRARRTVFHFHSRIREVFAVVNRAVNAPKTPLYAFSKPVRDVFETIARAVQDDYDLATVADTDELAVADPPQIQWVSLTNLEWKAQPVDWEDLLAKGKPKLRTKSFVALYYKGLGYSTRRTVELAAECWGLHLDFRYVKRTWAKYKATLTPDELQRLTRERYDIRRDFDWALPGTDVRLVDRVVELPPVVIDGPVAWTDDPPIGPTRFEWSHLRSGQ